MVRRSTRGSKAFATLTLESDTLTPSIKALPGEVNKVIKTTMRYYEGQTENYARLNAPWNDQTGNARSGLRAKSGQSGETHYIVLFHQVPYGIWLEVRFAGRNAIIMPTIEAISPKIMSTLVGILNKRYGGFA